MKSLVAIATLSFLAGCGSSGGDPVFGGFVPTGGSALIFTQAVCDVSFVGSTALSAVALDFTSYQDSCGVITETALCGNKASATRVLAVLLSGEVGAASTDPFGPGTYPFLPEPPSGSFKAATAQAVQDDEACEPLSGDANLAMTGGSVSITSVTESTVSGSTNIRLENGQVFEYSFNLTTCSATIDLCTRFLPCTNRVCVP